MKKKLQPAITLLQQYMAQDMTVYAGHATLFLLTAFFPLLMWLLVVVNTLPGFTSISMYPKLMDVGCTVWSASVRWQPSDCPS